MAGKVMQMIPEKVVMDRLSQVLQAPVEDALWDYLIRKDCIQEVQVGRGRDINWLAGEARDVMEAGGGGARGKPAPRMLQETKPTDQGPELTTLRHQALSLLIAKRARNEPMVKAFREEVLGGELLAFGDIRRWMEEQGEKDGTEISSWLTVPVAEDPEGVIMTELHAAPLEHQRGMERFSPSPYSGTIDGFTSSRYLEYGMPGTMWSRFEFIKAGGVLDRLLTLTERLVEPLASLSSPSVPYPWTHAQGAVFVLTGLAPEVHSVKYRVRESVWLRGATRILLDIDPNTTPDEVARQYRSVRNKISNRPRTMDEKHLRLAAFAADRPESETWDAKLLAWNEAYPEPQYPDYNYAPEDRRNFYKHVSEACDRLLNPDFPPLWETDSSRYGKPVQAEQPRAPVDNATRRSPTVARKLPGGKYDTEEQ